MTSPGEAKESQKNHGGTTRHTVHTAGCPISAPPQPEGDLDMPDGMTALIVADDQKLIELGEAWRRTCTDIDAIQEEMAIIQDRVRDECPEPQILKWDVGFSDGQQAVVGRRRHSVSHFTTRAKETLASNPWGIAAYMPMNEKIAIIDGWQSEADAVYRRLGFIALEERLKLSQSTRDTIEQEILRAAAQTPAGMAVKLRVIDHYRGFSANGDDWSEYWLGETLRQAERWAGLKETSRFDRLKFFIRTSINDGVEVMNSSGKTKFQIKRFPKGWSAKRVEPGARLGRKRWETPLEAVASLIHPSARPALEAAFRHWSWDDDYECGVKVKP